MNSLLRYPGGKNRFYKHIKPLILPHKVWVDATWGAGSVSIKKDPSLWEIACDINDDIIRFNKLVQEHYKEISHWISLLSYEEKTFDWAADWKQCDGEEFAVKTIVRNRMSFDANMKGYTWSDRLRRGMPEFLSVWAGLPERIIQFGKRIQNFIFSCRDVVESIELVYHNPNALIYIDLPYKIGERTSTNLYERDTLDETHTRMLTALQGSKCHSIISHYDDEEYSKMLLGWNRKEIPLKLNMGNKTIKNSRTEVIWHR